MTTGTENDEDAPVLSNAFREQQERDYEVMFGKAMTTATSTRKCTITYYYRGLIERGADYHWTEGWSAQSENNHPLYPWNTKRECQREAKSQGAKAVFVRDEQYRLA